MTGDPFKTRLEAARSGNHQAIDGLLRHVESRLRSRIDRRLGAKMRTWLRDSDILQNAYLEILRSLPSLQADTEEGFIAWITTIIENDIRRERRWFGAAKRLRTASKEDNLLASILLRAPKTPSGELIEEEGTMRLEDALANLPPDYRDVLRLAVFEELPHRGIAQRLNRTEPATRMLLSRARAALSVELERLELDAGS